MTMIVRNLRKVDADVRSLVEEVVSNVRSEQGDRRLSPPMRKIVNGVAQEVLRDDHGLLVSLRVIRKIA